MPYMSKSQVMKFLIHLDFGATCTQQSVSSASVSVFSLRKNSLQGSQGLIHHCLVPYIISEISEETKDACGSE